MRHPVLALNYQCKMILLFNRNKLFLDEQKVIKTLVIKFGLSEEHRFEKIFLMVLTIQLIYLVNVKTMRKIFSNYVCISKSPNFNTETTISMYSFMLFYAFTMAVAIVLLRENSQS